MPHPLSILRVNALQGGWMRSVRRKGAQGGGGGGGGGAHEGGGVSVPLGGFISNTLHV